MLWAHIVDKLLLTPFANRGQGEDKEDIQRVSDAENGRMGSDEALPERSDRERDEPASGGSGARSPHSTLVNSLFLRHCLFSVSIS